MSLPSGYKRLEYIQSTGTQYVDSGITINSTTYKKYRFLFDIGYPFISGSYWLVNGNSGGNVIYYFGLSNTGKIVYGNGTTDVFGSVTATTGRYLIDFNPAGGSYKFGDLQYLTGLTFNAPSGSQNFYLFAYNKGGSQDMHTERLFSAKIYDNGTLVRDYIPCQTTAGEIGLWDDANSVFYGNSGTGTFTAGPVVAIAADTSEITELEYIQSSGTQFIDTGVVPKNNTRVDVDCDITYGTGWIMILGSYDTNKYFSWWANGTTIYAYYGTSNNNVAGENGKQTLSANKNIWSAGNSAMSFSEVSFTANSSIYLFSVNNGGNYSKASMKLYSCQIYDNNTLIRNYIAAKLSDGTVGLYDKLSGLLYINAGTGTFEAGPSSLNLPVNIGGTWKDANEAFINIGGTWKTVEDAFVNIGGAWKKIG